MRLNRFWLGLGIVVLGSLSVAAQGDTILHVPPDSSSFRGTIKVVRPGIKPIVNVDLEYRLYKGKLTDGMDSKKIPNAPKGVAFVGDKTNVIANGAEYPMPSAIDLPGFDKYIIPGPGDAISPMDGFLNFDFNKFFTENLGYIYPYAATNKVDTVRIVLSITKEGTFVFNYKKDRKNPVLTIVDQKCFEVLGHIKSWNPAKLLIYSGDGSRLRRKKKANCIVNMTLLVTAQLGAPEFDALWEEAEK